jgi:hypothetical protein
MPFDAIYILFGFEGLCPPGLGTDHYVEVSLALMDLLPCLLPVKSIPCISATVVAVTMDSNNGYNSLLHYGSLCSWLQPHTATFGAIIGLIYQSLSVLPFPPLLLQNSKGKGHLLQ